MNTQSANQQQNIEVRIRTMRFLWIAMFVSIVLYYMLTFFVRPSEGVESNDTLFLILVIFALSTTLISFPIKNKLLTRAVDQQQVQLVQQAYIVALALTEVAALMGLLVFFMSRHRYYYVLFLVGALGQLLHFPRREHVINAYPKSPIF